MIRETIAKLVAEGSIVAKTVEFASTVEPAAKFKGVCLEKVVKAKYEIGKPYTPPMREDGTPGDPMGLGWGQWETYPYVIDHNQTKYLRLTPMEGDVSVKFLVNNETVTREKFAEYLTPYKAKQLFEKGKPGDVISVKFENILSIS